MKRWIFRRWLYCSINVFVHINCSKQCRINYIDNCWNFCYNYLTTIIFIYFILKVFMNKIPHWYYVHCIYLSYKYETFITFASLYISYNIDDRRSSPRDLVITRATTTDMSYKNESSGPRNLLPPPVDTHSTTKKKVGNSCEIWGTSLLLFSCQRLAWNGIFYDGQLLRVTSVPGKNRQDLIRWGNTQTVHPFPVHCYSED